MTAEVAEERTVQGSTRAPSRSSHLEEKDLHEKPEFETTVDTTKPRDPEAQQVAQAPKTEFPEGGLRGWATVAGAFCVQFCGFGYTSSFGVYQDYYVRVYMTNETASTISWIGSVNAFIVVGFGLFAGQLYDRGHFKLAIYLGSFLLVFGLFMLSLAQPNQFYQVFLSQGVCAGIGAGLLYIPSIAVISHYFARRRVLAMSIVAAGSSLGSVIHPIMLNNTLNGSLGFGNSVRASAGLVAGMLLVAILLMKPRLPPPAHTTPLLPAIRKFSKDSAYVWTTAGLFLVTTGFYYPLYYLQLDASEHNLSREFSFYCLVILNFASFVGRLSSGFAAHTVGAPLTITVSAGCCAAVILGMIGVGSVTSVVLVALFFGFFAGAYIALNAPMLAVLADSFGEIGARMGVAFAFAAIGGLIGSPIAGALLGDSYVWWKPAVFAGIFAFAGFGCFCMACIILKRRGKLLPHHP
ncbi:MFS general substrate transporter [Phanerochaete sordida]|uniref:MFS general substrate transporter n=1 Tax=Phanerochaete sordida TaxID=48140 RepID=A0A9P3GF83_9APHY|nr:MFS general substrate transporter [Phanerochaete sordida]